MRLNIFVSQGPAMNVNTCFLDLYILKGFREGVFEKYFFSMQMLTSGNLNCNKLVTPLRHACPTQPLTNTANESGS